MVVVVVAVMRAGLCSDCAAAFPCTRCHRCRRSSPPPPICPRKPKKPVLPRATLLSHILAAFARKISHRRDVLRSRESASGDARARARGPVFSRVHKLPRLPESYRSYVPAARSFYSFPFSLVVARETPGDTTPRDSPHNSRSTAFDKFERSYRQLALVFSSGWRDRNRKKMKRSKLL